MKKYIGLYEAEKRKYVEALQRYQEDHIEEMEMFFNIKKDFTRIGAKEGARASMKQCHLFLMDQFDKMTEEDGKNYRRFVSRRWKEIKKDLKRLVEYNNRTKKLRDETVKVKHTFSEDEKYYFRVGHRLCKEKECEKTFSGEIKYRGNSKKQ